MVRKTVGTRVFLVLAIGHSCTDAPCQYIVVDPDQITLFALSTLALPWANPSPHQCPTCSRASIPASGADATTLYKLSVVLSYIQSLVLIPSLLPNKYNAKLKMRHIPRVLPCDWQTRRACLILIGLNDKSVGQSRRNIIGQCPGSSQVLHHSSR